MVYLYSLLIIEILIITGLYVIHKGDIISPSLMSMLTFFAATVCIIFNENFWDVSYHFTTFAIVIFGFLMIALADIFVWSNCSRQSAYRTRYSLVNCPDFCVYIRKDWLVLIYIVMSLCLLILIYELRQMGNSLQASGLQIIGVVKESDLRFDVVGRIAYQINNILSVIVIYIVAFNSGCQKGHRLKNIIKYLPLVVISFIGMFITGQRSLLIRAIFIYIVVYAISFKRGRADSSKSTKELVKKIGLPLATVIFVFYASRVVVKGIGGWSANKSFLEYITYYVGSPLYLFDTYVQAPSSIVRGPSYFGGFCFADFYATLYKMGLIDEPVSKLAFSAVGGGTSYGGNEYSLFMRPMADFGVVGMLIFVFLLYTVFSYIYYYKIRQFRPTGRSVRRLMVYSYFYYIIPMAFYYPFTVQESKPMNIIYMLLLILIARYLVKIKET